MINLFKKKGETPLECLTRFRSRNPEYADTKLSYAGRLDPLAEGVLPVMVGDENKDRTKFLYTDKEYEIAVLIGISTDTGDVLGLVNKIEEKVLSDAVERINLHKFVGSFNQTYPAYSSRNVDRGGLARRTTKTKKVEIYSIEKFGKIEIIAADSLLKKILEDIGLVGGNFRQDIIKKTWATKIKAKEYLFPVFYLRVRCSSGTYMRLLAENIGKSMGVPALALSIKRTRASNMRISDSLL